MGRSPTPGGFDRFETHIHRLASVLVVFGGLCLLLACGLTLASVIGSVALRPLPGEIELVEALCGFAVFAFLPYCQLKRGHVGVDLFISALGTRAMNISQLIGDVLIGILLAVVTWRHYVGLTDKFGNGETTPLLLLPVWWGYAIAFVLLLANILVCIHIILADLRDIRHGRAIIASSGAH